jgi:glutamyl-tRNA synthetase
MGMTLVARGRDHLGSTPQQLLLYQALGWEPPEFAHLPLMLSPKGEKLSKRHAAVAVQDYRNRGYTPDGVMNYLARFGWSYGDMEIFSRAQLVELFDWTRVGKSDGKFDEKKFADVAFEHLKRPDLTPTKAYATGVVPFLVERGLEVAASSVEPGIATIRERARSLADAAMHLDYYHRDPPEMDEAARKKFLTADVADALDAFRAVVAETDPFSSEELERRVQAWLTESGVPMKQVSQPARVALTGRKASPGLYDVMRVLGRTRSLERLDRGIALARAQT